MHVTKVVVTEPKGRRATVEVESYTLAAMLIHAGGGGITEQQTARSIEAKNALWEGKAVRLGGWKFEPAGADQ